MFCKRHFQISFIQWELFYLYSNCFHYFKGCMKNIHRVKFLQWKYIFGTVLLWKYPFQRLLDNVRFKMLYILHTRLYFDIFKLQYVCTQRLVTNVLVLRRWWTLVILHVHFISWMKSQWIPLRSANAVNPKAGVIWIFWRRPSNNALSILSTFISTLCVDKSLKYALYTGILATFRVYCTWFYCSYASITQM